MSAEKSGIAAFKGRTMGVTAADFDGDGYPDIYVANDKTENFLFHNQRDGTFKEMATEAGVAYGQNGENTSAMGPVFADFDGDGKWICGFRTPSTTACTGTWAGFNSRTSRRKRVSRTWPRST